MPSRDADLIVEAVPERLDLKRRVYAEVEAAARPDALIASSTSGILPTDLQADLKHPGRLIVAHPFNPVYLIPVVEIVGGKATAPEAIAAAMAFYPTLGMKPVLIRKEIEAFVADRLLEVALARGAVADPRRHLHHAKSSTTLSATASACAGRRWACSTPTASPAARPACATSWPSSAPASPGRGRT